MAGENLFPSSCISCRLDRRCWPGPRASRSRRSDWRSKPSPWPATWFGGYTGGWAGYIPTPDAYPQGGYEVDTSPFAPEAAGRLVMETLAALEELHVLTKQDTVMMDIAAEVD